MIQLHQIDPIAFHLGPLQVHWYGIMYLLGFATAWWLGRRRIRAGRLPGVDDQGFGDLLFYGMLGVVLGGRIGYVLFYAFGDFLANPLMLFKVWEGGMSFHGGLLGVAAAVFWWARKRRLHVFDVIDFVAEHQPDAIIYDVAIPYEENWRFLRLLQSSEALKDVKWVITTTHRKRLEELVGECGEVYEVVGKPYDLIQITSAVKDALADD